LLDADELRRQLRVMKRMGLGGAFMHSRVGLATPYLADEWFEMVDACTDECRKIGLEAWLYDEDRWPSGAAGGLVTKDPRYRERQLFATVVQPGKSYKIRGDVLCSYSALLEGGELREAEAVKVAAKGTWKKGKRQLVVLAVTESEGSSWYNGYTYLDTMNHEAVQKFIEVTHEAYARRSGKEFGKTIPGMFTDEPNYGRAITQEASSGRTAQAYSVPWTPALPQTFKKRYGYDILDFLLDVFFDVDGTKVSPARYHFYDCITFLFVDAFARQCGEWCERNNLAFTGHVLLEGKPSSQTMVVGDAMRFYEHMHVPGIDILTAAGGEYDTVKQCSSVARQTGRKWVLSELYGCTGWDFTFEGHKAIGDWQAAMGITLRCQHLSWFTMAGEAKRDFPASILHQSPWWREYPKVEDYFSRVGVLMTTGEAVCNVLVIHPIESTWVRHKVGWQKDADVKRLDRNLAKLRNWLLQAQLDFDYGNEEMMSRIASVRCSKSGAVLKVGKAAYTTVVVPPMITMQGSTVKLLDKFIATGGSVIFAGKVADHVDAVPCRCAKRVAAKAARVPFSSSAMVEAVEPTGRVIRVTDSRGGPVTSAIYQLREDAKGRYLFVCNDDRKRGFEAVDIEIDARFAEEWDADTGERFVPVCSRKDGRMVVHTSLPPSGSRSFVFPKTKTAGLRSRPAMRKARSIQLPDVWDIQLTEPNVVVLDRPKWRVGGGKWNKPTEILKLDNQARDKMGLQRRGYSMVQPWAQEPDPNPKTASLELCYTFDVKELPSGHLHLAIENPDHFRILLNGIEVEKDSECGWWVDKAIRRIELTPGALKVGQNCLTIQCPKFHKRVDLEIIYILGNFGVKVRASESTIVAAPRRLRTGNWVTQSLPFYSASVIYRTRVKARLGKGQRAVLSLPRWKGTCVIVHADGKPLGTLGWPPYEIDITDALAGGPVDLGIEVVGSRRNAFGPLHQADPQSAWTGPGEYRLPGKWWVEDFNLKPCGLLQRPVLKILR
ncbi:MAG: glycosyl hydrolase, partial [Phycisphaerae bacterium]|nr:glycosyl hydrolase [Phycisphaerae bacterium]